MPYKEACIEFVDAMDASAEASVGEHHREHRRTAARLQRRLPGRGEALADHHVPVDHTVSVLGSGGMAKAVVAALRDAGFHAGTVVARNALADQYGYAWRAEVGSSRPQLLVNATPVGMSGGPAAEDLPVAPEVVDSAETVFDVVALPALTPLVRRARAQGKQVIIGTEGIALQAVEQFALYTGVRPTDDRSVAPRSSPAHSPTSKIAARAFSSVQDASGVAFGPRAAPRPCPAGPTGGEYGGTAIRLQLGRARRLGGLVGAWQPGQGR
jgi:shikimate dehydrogenase